MKLKIPINIHAQISLCVEKCAGEVSGLGRVKYDASTDTLEVTKIYLPKQVVTSTSTDIDKDSIFEIEATEQTDSHLGFLCYHWHSHANMGVFFSSTDKETYQEIGKQGLCVASVFNKKGETKSCLCYKTNFLGGHTQVVSVDDLTTEIETFQLSSEERLRWLQAINDNVSAPQYPIYPQQTRWNLDSEREHNYYADRSDLTDLELYETQYEKQNTFYNKKQHKRMKQDFKNNYWGR